jgi:hypothetical protein
MNTVLALNNDQMGQGDGELGRKLLGAFLGKSPVMKALTGIVFYNAGVKLIVRGSPVLPALKQLHDAGVDLFPCGTCLAYYGLEPEIVRASDMDEIIRELDRAEKVITL